MSASVLYRHTHVHDNDDTSHCSSALDDNGRTSMLICGVPITKDRRLDRANLREKTR